MKTNLTQDQMFDMQKNYKDCLQNSEDIQISGDGHIAADGIWYYYVPEAAKQDLTNKLRAHLEVTKYMYNPTPLGFIFCVNLY